MTESRERAAWARCACLRADIRNSNPFRKGDPVHPNELNPYAPKQQPSKATEISIRDLKDLLAPPA